MTTTNFGRVFKESIDCSRGRLSYRKVEKMLEEAVPSFTANASNHIVRWMRGEGQLPSKEICLALGQLLVQRGYPRVLRFDDSSSLCEACPPVGCLWLATVQDHIERLPQELRDQIDIEVLT